MLRLEGLWQCLGMESEFRDPYTLKTFYVSFVRLKLEYASCVWRPFYGAYIDRIKRVQKKFVRYALRGLGWMDMFDLPPFVSIFNIGGLVNRSDIKICNLTLH
jgi:hypothetical protein